jgi:uncharacterized radical SAM superfamily Fe-S cluster-containing enzyme
VARRERPYLFYGATRALCAVCLRVCDAKELIQDGKVYLWKRCAEHGEQRALLSDDVAYFRLCREVFLKPPEQVERYNTPFRFGCPYDCGICPDHEQHGCVSVLEITDHCNLRCPTCYASSGPDRSTHRSMDEIAGMLDRIVANEGVADVVQVSGGEPTLHPQFFDVLDVCRARSIRHLMVNTNGIRIARDAEFADRLATYARGFEVYLQFDAVDDAANRALRGSDLDALRRAALERLNALNISTTLVATLKRGINDDAIGDLLRFAATQRCVRGVTLQPVQDAGRNDRFDPATHRLTLAEVRRRVYEQFPVFAPEDVVPVPCHPDSVAMAYALRGQGDDYAALAPLTRFIPPKVLIEGGKNTIIYEGDRTLVADVSRQLFTAFSTAHGPDSAAVALKDLLCCLPRVETLPDLGYDRVFRVIIMQFLDRHTIDLRSVRKSCVHIAHRDGKRMIPFDTYNLFYRDELETERLVPLRTSVARA